MLIVRLSANRANKENNIKLSTRQQASQGGYAVQQYQQEFDRYQHFLIVGPQSKQSDVKSGALDRGQTGGPGHLPRKQQGMAAPSCVWSHCVLT